MRRMHGLVFAVVAAGCTDYDLRLRDKSPRGGRDSADIEWTEDTAAPDTGDTGTPSDSGNTGPDDTDDPGVATAVNYVHTARTLYAWDAFSGLVRVGDFSEGGGFADDITDIAIDADGRMMAVSFTTLYRVDAATAALTAVAPLPGGSFAGLAFAGDGTLIGAGDGLWRIDPATGAATVLPGTAGITTSGDVVGLPDGQLYWTTLGSAGDDLYTVDPSTGAAQRVGAIAESGLWGIGYTDERLYGFSSAGLVVEIDPATAAVTDTVPLAGTWWGATTNPVRWE